MKDKTCCFTGHRVIPAANYGNIQKRLEAEIINFIHQGILYFVSGGALGFDTMAAQCVLKLKKRFPDIRLILVLPCKDQTKGWSENDKEVYGYILKEADKAVYTAERYHTGCMQKRNRHLVDGSCTCICFLTKARGGTAYTVGYARKKGLSIINIAEE